MNKKANNNRIYCVKVYRTVVYCQISLLIYFKGVVKTWEEYVLSLIVTSFCLRVLILFFVNDQVKIILNLTEEYRKWGGDNSQLLLLSLIHILYYLTHLLCLRYLHTRPRAHTHTHTPVYRENEIDNKMCGVTCTFTYSWPSVLLLPHSDYCAWGVFNI